MVLVLDGKLFLVIHMMISFSYTLHDFFFPRVLTWPALMKSCYSLYKMVISGAEPAAIILTPWL